MASSTRETESKFVLDRDGFERIRESLHVIRTLEQRNIYYDQFSRLARMSATCRFRFEDKETPVFTVKLPISKCEGIRKMDELHVEDPDASPETAPSEIDVERGLPPRLAEALLNLGVNELRCVGQARNWRTVGSVEGLDGQLELDRLELPSGEIVFEAEIESENHSTHGAWASWIQRIAPTAHQSVLSKAERVIRALDTAEVR